MFVTNVGPEDLWMWRIYAQEDLTRNSRPPSITSCGYADFAICSKTLDFGINDHATYGNMGSIRKGTIMSGTRAGGLIAAAKNRALRANFYGEIGRKGGLISRGGGFESNIVGADGLTGRARAVTQGAIGGATSRRTKPKIAPPEHYTLVGRIKTRFGIK